MAVLNGLVAVAVLIRGTPKGAQVSTGVPPSSSGYHGLFTASLSDAKYIDLTHTISPDMPIWAAFDKGKLSVSLRLEP